MLGIVGAQKLRARWNLAVDEQSFGVATVRR
jgi:hypothetical protein